MQEGQSGADKTDIRPKTDNNSAEGSTKPGQKRKKPSQTMVIGEQKLGVLADGEREHEGFI